jgi:protein-S-isoprenylcysteine O-methyltransferase Ste14
MSRTMLTNRPRSNVTPAWGPAVMVYAGLAYTAFVAAALWAIAFLADLSTPHTVDGTSRRPVWAALLVDACLLLVFAVQHSVMARAGFKRRLARVFPVAAERSTYVLAASLALGLLFWQWQPLPASVWHVGAQPWAALIWVVYAVGWLIVVATTFMIDHLDFLGLRQAYSHTRQRPYQPPSFSERWLYAWVRHPMMLGLLIAFWATPTMTAGHLLFAIAASAYVAIGLKFEERDLTRLLGPTYSDYAHRVPALIPAPHRLHARRTGRQPAGAHDLACEANEFVPSKRATGCGPLGRQRQTVPCTSSSAPPVASPARCHPSPITGTAGHRD